VGLRRSRNPGLAASVSASASHPPLISREGSLSWVFHALAARSKAYPLLVKPFLAAQAPGTKKFIWLHRAKSDEGHPAAARAAEHGGA
jgi:hypothetical protein